MVAYDDVERFIRDEIAVMTPMPPGQRHRRHSLVGKGRVVDSADLVMLMLSVEEFARDRLGAAFDWTSDSAMSEARSVLRSIGTLACHLTELQTA